MSGFWAGGSSAYERGLAEDRDQKVRVLRQRLKTAETQAGRERLLQEIKEVHGAYRARKKAVGRCLF